MRLKRLDIVLICLILFLLIFTIYDSAVGLGIISDKRVRAVLIILIVLVYIRNIRRDWKYKKKAGKT